jgi:hypothetical protein
MNVVVRILIFYSCLFPQYLKGQTDLDSAKKFFYKDQPSGDVFIKSCFFIADQFMDYEQYDSAQIWLNKIADRLPLKKPTLFNYYLSSRQEEVYYYNGLQRLGLQESERCMQIAKSLADSLLMADSYNFVGLFYMNIDMLDSQCFQNRKILLNINIFRLLMNGCLNYCIPYSQ